VVVVVVVGIDNDVPSLPMVVLIMAVVVPPIVAGAGPVRRSAVARVWRTVAWVARAIHVPPR
jgi:hypothetical protein